MNIKQATAKWEALRKKIDAWNQAYYIQNTPLVSDFEYDVAMQELLFLEQQFPELRRPDSPTQHVGSDLRPEAEGFRKFPHKHPMLSLSNTYNAEELRDFDRRIRRSLPEGNPMEYNCELKFDGTAICLWYERGRLVRALTRGDGTYGDDVTSNILQIKSIPPILHGENIPKNFEIRGEILLPLNHFETLNRQREAAEEPLFANPRNAAAGTLKLLDPEEVGRRGLTAFFYHLIADPMPATTHSACLDMAASWGLPVSELCRRCASVEEVLQYLRQWETERSGLSVATDGVVVKINDLSLQKALGFTAKSPRWATAYKFKPEQALTPLLSVSFQVGRTGAVTPVANLQPVPLSGTVVKRASLHNADQITLLDLRIGDWVYVEKGGEIIPKVTGLEPAKRPAAATPFRFITECPECGTPLVRHEDEARHYCPNRWHCPPQVKGRILHFMSRKAMNILGGEALVEQLYNKALVQDASDLYFLLPRDLAVMENWGQKSTENLLQSIEASKSLSFDRVLFAIGIPQVGETTAKYMATHFGSLEAIRTAETETLCEAPEVGAIIARGIRDFFAEPLNLRLIAKLKEAGLQFEQKRQTASMISNRLDGLNFVVSGLFTRDRESMKQLLQAHGAVITGAVSAKTDYLLAGEKMGPAKREKAIQMGVKLLTENELYRMLDMPVTETPLI